MRFVAHSHKFVELDEGDWELVRRWNSSSASDTPPPSKQSRIARSVQRQQRDPSEVPATNSIYNRLCQIVREKLFLRLVPQLPERHKVASEDGNRRAVDVFFVHPTGFFGARWNGCVFIHEKSACAQCVDVL